VASGTAAPTTEADLLRLAASAERGSEHPVAAAIITEAERRKLELHEPERFEAQAGCGVTATVGGRTVTVGRPTWSEAHGSLPDEANQLVARFAARGKTAMVVAVEGKVLGVLAVADEIKPTSAAAVAQLHRDGLETVMLTGDDARAAAHVAEAVNIHEFVAGVLPADKERFIRQAQARGERVAMVGDGVNDAPALARADVGIAIGSGSDVAKEASDVTLVGNDLMGVPRAISLSRSTVRTIRQNLFWAFFYNVALIPVAAGALASVAVLPDFIRHLHPAMAAAAMALSSLTVVANSLRLARR
jgi:Cu+-exporting ATPase